MNMLNDQETTETRHQQDLIPRHIKKVFLPTNSKVTTFSHKAY